MEHDVVLTFQALSKQLLRPLIRRLFLPIVAGICAPFLLVALLIELAGGDRSLAVICAASGVLTTLILPWYVASETVKRAALRFGHATAYRIDRTAGRFRYPHIDLARDHQDRTATGPGGPVLRPA